MLTCPIQVKTLGKRKLFVSTRLTTELFLSMAEPAAYQRLCSSLWCRVVPRKWLSSWRQPGDLKIKELGINAEGFQLIVAQFKKLILLPKVANQEHERDGCRSKADVLLYLFFPYLLVWYQW